MPLTGCLLLCFHGVSVGQGQDFEECRDQPELRRQDTEARWGRWILSQALLIVDEYSMSPYGNKPFVLFWKEPMWTSVKLGGGACSEQTYPAHTRGNIVV